MSNPVKNPSRRAARGRTPSGAANPIDIHVGHRVRVRRTLLGLTQGRLGASLGLTFQQVQKYEKGANRMGASRLFDLSRILGVSITWFFEEMAEGVAEASPAAMRSATVDPEISQVADAESRRETLQLVRALEMLSPEQRSIIETMIHNLATEE